MARILILGGTGWLGSEIASAALSRGDEVTCLARGQSGSVPDGAELVIADRAEPGAYDDVASRDWDDVIEVSWQPRFVKAALGKIAPRAAHWTYVSSASVYADNAQAGATESAALLNPLEDLTSEADREHYGQAKVACEHLSAEAAGDRLLIARPGLIGGPGDPSDRFGYWVSRFALAASGAVLVPANQEQLTQVIDVRDLAAWLILAGANSLTGVVNTVGDEQPLEHVLRLSRDAAQFTGSLAEATEDWLVAHEVDYWSGPHSLPLWLPSSEEYSAFGRRDHSRYTREGGMLRSLDEMLAETLADERARGLDRSRASGLDRKTELALIDALFSDDDSRG